MNQLNAFAVSVVFGSFAMIGWGLADYLVKGIAVRIEAYRLLLYTDLFGMLLFTLFVFTGDVPWSGTIPGIKLAFVSGILHVITMLCYYSAIKLGKLSLVSPVGASWGIVPIMISILFLGEKLGFSDSILVSLIVLGVIMISLHPRGDEHDNQNSALFLALIAAFAGGLNVVILKFVSLDIGEVNAVFYLRLFGIILMSPGLLLVSKRPRWIPQDTSLKQGAILVIVGILNTAGFLAYVKGLTEGYISIVSPVAASSPVVTVVLAGILLKERVRIHQGMGVALVLLGVILLSTL